MLFRSGISPILPSDIESVEVSEIVTARYLEQGYTDVYKRQELTIAQYVDNERENTILVTASFRSFPFIVSRTIW